MTETIIGSPSRVFLMGFMGSGKSTVGRKLAARLGYDFYDLDHFIEETVGASIADIFSFGGEETFRGAEEEALRFLGAKENVLISLGGGTPCYGNNMDIIEELGTSIYLNVPFSILIGRLRRNRVKRPLIAEMSEEELDAFVSKSLDDREPIYKRATIDFKYMGEHLSQIVAALELEVKKAG
ncbi:AAA family ATPase [Chitinophagales bacterium]|nr:AAA family ATPase [Chitinophagales bacterium]